MGFRAPLSVIALAIAVAISLASCGGSDGGTSTTDSEKAADAEVLNASLARELALVEVYSEAIPRLPRPQVPVAQQLRSQVLEHVDAITKAIRGLGEEADAEQAEVDYAEVKSGADFLTLAYGMEGAAYAANLDAATLLATDAPRKLSTALAAGEAQHLVALRQLLGAGLRESFPEAFESGEIPAPEMSAAAGQAPREKLSPGATLPSGDSKTNDNLTLPPPTSPTADELGAGVPHDGPEGGGD